LAEKLNLIDLQIYYIYFQNEIEFLELVFDDPQRKIDEEKNKKPKDPFRLLYFLLNKSNDNQNMDGEMT